jgi:hypothetical protein
MVTGVDLTVDRVEVQSAQMRDGQPPIRMRVGSPKASPRIMDADFADDLLGPPAAADTPLLPARTTSRGYKR